MHNFPENRNGFKQKVTQILTPFTGTGFHIMVHFALVVKWFLELALTSDKILGLGEKKMHLVKGHQSKAGKMILALEDGF